MKILRAQNIDADDYFYMLAHRGFTTELAIKHTNDFYEISNNSFMNNIMKLEHKIDFDDNDYMFTQEKKGEDNRTKVCYDLSKKYNDRSVATLNWRKIYARFDNIRTLGFDEVHHIYPVYLGGENCYYNLIGVSKVIHSYLHNAWWEENRKLCNRAVDYLCILSWQKPAFDIIKHISEDSDDLSFLKTRFENEICIKLMKYMENFRDDRTKK